MPTDRAEQYAALPRAAKRGDLAIIRTITRISRSSGPSYDMTSYRVGVVASVTRDGQVKAVRWPTDDPDRKPELVARMGRHELTTVPATAVDVPAATAAIVAGRAEKNTGYLPPYDTPDQVLRELTPHTRDRDALAQLTADTRRRAQEEIDFHRAVCARCGVNTYGNGTVSTDETGCPVAVCKTCPSEVEFATAYPTGLEVMVTDGFAAGAVAKIEAVADAYPTDPRTGQARYAGRAYVVTLPHWGRRTFPEAYVRPTNDAATAKYAVHRDHLATSKSAEQQELAAAGATTPKETTVETEQPAAVSAPYDADTAYVHVGDWDGPVKPDAEWVVWNTARPLMGSKTWQGTFRRGAFYAAARRDDPQFQRWAEENRKLDGHHVEVVDNGRSRELLDQLLQGNGYSVQDYLDADMSIGDTARDRGLPWSDTDTSADAVPAGPDDVTPKDGTPQQQDDWERRKTHLVARNRFTDEEWAEAKAGRCAHVVEYGNGRGVIYCGEQSHPESPFANCEKHDRQVLDESPGSWPADAYEPDEHPYSLGYDEAETGEAATSTDPDYLDGYLHAAQNHLRSDLHPASFIAGFVDGNETARDAAQDLKGASPEYRRGYELSRARAVESGDPWKNADFCNGWADRMNGMSEQADASTEYRNGYETAGRDLAARKETTTAPGGNTMTATTDDQPITVEAGTKGKVARLIDACRKLADHSGKVVASLDGPGEAGQLVISELEQYAEAYLDRARQLESHIAAASTLDAETRAHLSRMRETALQAAAKFQTTADNVRDALQEGRTKAAEQVALLGNQATAAADHIHTGHRHRAEAIQTGPVAASTSIADYQAV